MHSTLEIPRGFQLKVAIGRYQNSLHELNEYMNLLNADDNRIEYDLYDKIRNLAEEMISAGSNVVQCLEDILEDTDIPTRGPIPGAALKPRIDIEESMKNQIVNIVLKCAVQILRSDYDTVSHLAEEISEICENHINDQKNNK